MKELLVEVILETLDFCVIQSIIMSFQFVSLVIFVAGRSCWEAHRVQSKHQGAVTWIHGALKAAEVCSQLVPRRLVGHQQTASWELGFVCDVYC